MHPFFCPKKEVKWTLEGYLAGEFEEADDKGLCVDPGVYGIEDDGGVEVANGYDREGKKPLSREIIYAGCGDLQYERVAEGWSGW